MAVLALIGLVAVLPSFFPVPLWDLVSAVVFKYVPLWAMKFNYTAMAIACAQRTGVAASVERRRREHARAISLE